MIAFERCLEYTNLKKECDKNLTSDFNTNNQTSVRFIDY